MNKNQLTKQVKGMVSTASNKINTAVTKAKRKFNNYRKKKAVNFNRKVRSEYGLDQVDIDAVPTSITVNPRTNKIISLTYRTRNNKI